MGNLHIGLAALGAALAVGIDRHEGVGSGRTQSRRRDAGAGPVDSGHRVCGSDRVLHAVPRAVRRVRRIRRPRGPNHDGLCLDGAGRAAGRSQEIARTFGVDWPHLTAQIISFGIVCALLYWLAYQPVLRMLDERRQQIAQGLANTEKINAALAGIEAQRQGVLADAQAQATQADRRSPRHRHAPARAGNAARHRRRRADHGPGARGRGAGARPHARPSFAAKSAGWSCRRRPRSSGRC